MVSIITRAAKGAPLSNAEQDQNLLNLKAAVEMLSGGGVKVVAFSQDPANGDLTIEYSDGTSIGPIILPRQPVSVRGAWGTGRPYAAGDLVTQDGSAYIVAEAHVSTTFAADLAAGRLVLLAAKGDSGGFDDAPSTGAPFGRQDGDWTPVLAPVPADGKSYVQQGGGYATILPNAPSDGKLYAQKDGSWTVVTTNGISHAASDGSFYASKDGAWASFTPGIAHGPSDGKVRGSKDGAWVEIVASGGGGTGNLRHRGEWSASTSYEKWDVVEYAGMTWLARDTYFTQAPAPAFSQEGYWLPLGFPGTATVEPSAPRILHKFAAGSRTTLMTLADILNEFENRLKALE